MKINEILHIVFWPLIVIVLLNVILQMITFILMPPVTMIIVLLNFLVPFVFAGYSGFETIKKLKSGILEGGIAGCITLVCGYLISIIAIVILVYSGVFNTIILIFTPQGGPGFASLSSGITQPGYLIFGIVLSLVIGFIFGSVGGFIAQTVSK